MLRITDKVAIKAKEMLGSLDNWDAKSITNAIKKLGEELKEPSKVIMQVLRYALAGLEPGVGVPVIIEILGKETVLRRLDNARGYSSTS